MKKFISITASLLLTLSLLAGCGKSQAEKAPIQTEPSGSSTEPMTEPSTNPEMTEPSTEPIPTETEEDFQYEGDASSYYIDVVYAQQIERYHTAISQQWDADAYLEQEMCPLVVSYYGEKSLDNVGFTFMDLDADGVWELLIGAIQDAEKFPLLFEIWALKDDKPVMLAQSGTHNQYYLQYAEEDNLWSVAYEAKNGAATHAVYYLQLLEGQFQVTQGILFDAVANESAPWFMTYDLDWDVSNDTPIDEETANAVMEAGRKTYYAQEYFPYSLYK